MIPTTSVMYTLLLVLTHIISLLHHFGFWPLLSLEGISHRGPHQQQKQREICFAKNKYWFSTFLWSMVPRDATGNAGLVKIK